jgi:hypothetical protein
MQQLHEKKRSRAGFVKKKNALIATINPNWNDLAEEFGILFDE